MEYANATAWLLQSQQPQLQQQSQQQVLHSEQQPVQRPVTADWKEASTSGGNAPSAATPAQPTIDLSDFLGDLSAPQSASPLNNPSFFPFTNYFFSNNANQYNAMNYGSNNWSNASGTVPLSSYSTLNGATTSAPTTSQTQQPPSQQAVIDPALTTISTSSSSTHAHSYSPPNISPQSPQPPAQHPSSQYPYSHLPHSSNLSIPYSTSFQPNQQHQAQQQQHQPQFQGTLSPQALHAPSLGISPSSFYNSTPSLAQQAQAQANAEALQRQAEQHAQMRKDRFVSSIKQHLSAKAFSGAGGVRGLVSLIAEYGIADVDAQTRLDIVTKVRDHAGNHYFRAWVENGTAMDIMREWLKAGAAAGDDSPLVETIMPLLHITDRLPFNGDTLIASKIGKIVRKIGKDIAIPAVKDMASNLERKWREKFVAVQTPQEQAMSVDEESQDGKPRKRKSAEPPSRAPPAKKAAVASASSSKPTVVKREVRAGSSANVKDSKSDSSFFSAPKPKPKLPSFKKSAGPPVKKEHDPNVAQPSAIDPFQIALKDMAKARKASPAAAATPPSTSTPPQAAVGITKSGKKRKSVTWPPDGKLEQVKLIERAIYDDDPADGMHQMHNVRDLDRDEGAALHAHLFEELIDWFEPSPIEFPPEMEMRPRGEASVEKLTQEQRESTALGAMYLPQQIPDSPGEPAAQIPQEQVDEGVRMMLTGPEVDSLFWPPAADVPMAGVSVSDLVGQLAGAGAGTPDPSKALGFDAGVIAQMGGFPPDQLQQIAQMLQQQQPAYPGPSDAGQQAFDSENWGGQGELAGYGAEYAGDRRYNGNGADGWRGARGGRGRGGRGRGDGFRHSRSRIPCSFFAQGRCKYGDQCDFSHDPAY